MEAKHINLSNVFTNKETVYDYEQSNLINRIENIEVALRELGYYQTSDVTSIEFSPNAKALRVNTVSTDQISVSGKNSPMSVNNPVNTETAPLTQYKIVGGYINMKKGVYFNHMRHESTLGSCTVCHFDSSGGNIIEFGKEYAHGKGCKGCHTEMMKAEV